MTPGTRQVMEMCEADGCKMVGNDGDCGELGECSPRLIQITDKKHGEDQTKSAGQSERLPGCHFVPLEEREDMRTRTAPRKTHLCRSGRRTRHVCSGS